MKNVAFLIHPPDVAGAEKPLAVELDERFFRFFFTPVIAAEHLRTTNDDLPDFADAKLPPRRRVNDARVDVKRRNAETLQFRPVRRIEMRLRNRLRQPVAFKITDAGELEQFFPDRFRKRRSAAGNARKRGNVIPAKRRVGQKVDQHRADVHPMRAAVQFNQPGGRVPIPARHQHHGGAGENRRMHAMDHPRDMEKRQRRQRDRIARHIAPVVGADDVGVHRPVRVDAAFWHPGRPRCVRQDGDVINMAVVWKRRQLGAEAVRP